MPDDKNQGGLGQNDQSQGLGQGSTSSSFPYHETTTTIRKGNDTGPGDTPPPSEPPKDSGSSED